MMFLLLREVAHGWYTSPRVPIGKFRCSIYNAGIFTTISIPFDAHEASLYSNRFYVLLHYLNITVLLHHFWCEVLGYISCSYSCTLLLHRCMTSLMPGSLTVPELRAIHFPNSTWCTFTLSIWFSSSGIRWQLEQEGISGVEENHYSLF